MDASWTEESFRVERVLAPQAPRSYVRAGEARRLYLGQSRMSVLTGGVLAKGIAQD